jgi:hypothetical protein
MYTTPFRRGSFEPLWYFINQIISMVMLNYSFLLTFLPKSIIPRSWETEVTTSTDSPFSDKLMLYHIGFFQAA